MPSETPSKENKRTFLAPLKDGLDKKKQEDNHRRVMSPTNTSHTPRNATDWFRLCLLVLNGKVAISSDRSASLCEDTVKYILEEARSREESSKGDAIEGSPVDPPHNTGEPVPPSPSGRMTDVQQQISNAMKGVDKKSFSTPQSKLPSLENCSVQAATAAAIELLAARAMMGLELDSLAEAEMSLTLSKRAYELDKRNPLAIMAYAWSNYYVGLRCLDRGVQHACFLLGVRLAEEGLQYFCQQTQSGDAQFSPVHDASTTTLLPFDQEHHSLEYRYMIRLAWIHSACRGEPRAIQSALTILHERDPDHFLLLLLIVVQNSVYAGDPEALEASMEQLHDLYGDHIIVLLFSAILDRSRGHSVLPDGRDRSATLLVTALSRIELLSNGLFTTLELNKEISPNQQPTNPQEVNARGSASDNVNASSLRGTSPPLQTEPPANPMAMGSLNTASISGAAALNDRGNPIPTDATKENNGSTLPSALQGGGNGKTPAEGQKNAGSGLRSFVELAMPTIVGEGGEVEETWHRTALYWTLAAHVACQIGCYTIALTAIEAGLTLLSSAPRFFPYAYADLLATRVEVLICQWAMKHCSEVLRGISTRPTSVLQDLIAGPLNLNAPVAALTGEWLLDSVADLGLSGEGDEETSSSVIAPTPTAAGVQGHAFVEALSELGDLPQYLSKALDADPSHALTLYWFGYLKVIEGLYAEVPVEQQALLLAEACHYFALAAIRRPEIPRVSYATGCVHMSLGDSFGALNFFASTVEATEHWPLVSYERLTCLLRR